MKFLNTLVLAFMLPLTASASSVINFVWDIPTEREDGSPLPAIEISGYNLYEQGEKVAWIEGGDTTSVTYDYGGYGQPCFTISTTDFWNQEGSQSPETCVNVFPAPPSAPVYLNTSN
jgi:hypothetical protein